MRLSPGVIRFLLEAAFLCIVAGVLVVVEPGWRIVAVAMTAAWILAVSVEHALARRLRRAAGATKPGRLRPRRSFGVRRERVEGSPVAARLRLRFHRRRELFAVRARESRRRLGQRVAGPVHRASHRRSERQAAHTQTARRREAERLAAVQAGAEQERRAEEERERAAAAELEAEQRLQAERVAALERERMQRDADESREAKPRWRQARRAPARVDEQPAAAPPGPRPPVLAVPPAPSASEPAREIGPVRATAPREWNLWELEALAREDAGADQDRDEERSLLLLHLRPFASAEGVLPVEFDDLVREAFGELLVSRDRV